MRILQMEYQGYRISDELAQIFEENKDKRWMLSVDTIDVEGIYDLYSS